MIRQATYKIIALAVFSVPLALSSATGSFASAYQDAFNNRISSPGNTESLANFVTIAVDTGQYDQALSTIEQHLITYPRDAKARLIAGRLYNHVGSYKLALRQIDYALAIGTLSADEMQQAEKLQRRVQKSLSGITGYVSFTTGVEIVRSDFAPTAAISDRTDVNPYGEIYGTVRRSLNTPSDDAILLTIKARVARLFGDFDLSGGGGVFTAPSGRIALTYDKGLPNSGISSLRLAMSVYGSLYTFQSNQAIREYGVLAKFSARPSVDSLLFANFGYADLSSSDLLFTDYRLRAETGGVIRLTGKHSIGAAFRSQFDFTYGGVAVGQSFEGEFSYAGLLISKADGLTWTQRASLSAGYIELPDLNATAGTIFDGNFWMVRWDHAFEFNERNRIDLTTFYRKLNFDVSSRDQASYGVGLSYTYTFR